MSRESRLSGGSEALRRVRGRIAQAADMPWPVLLLGETGTGKTLAASEIHRLSARRGGPFVRADLGASVPTLVESELFGHVKGAFTGAEAARKGAFRVADGGTLFLDEVGNCPVSVQAKLLGALDHGEIKPVGSDRSQKVDVRVIAATNANLSAMASRGEFRRDLLSRLGGFEIFLPPLRERLGRIWTNSCRTCWSVRWRSYVGTGARPSLTRIEWRRMRGRRCACTRGLRT